MAAAILGIRVHTDFCRYRPEEWQVSDQAVVLLAHWNPAATTASREALESS